MAEKAEKATKAPKKKLIKGKTSSGLKYQIDPAVKDDIRVLRYMTLMNNQELPEMEQVKYLFDLLELIFGNGLDAFLNEVAYLHNGVADPASLIAELKEIIDAAKLKNS